MTLSALSLRRPVTTLMFYAGIVLIGIAGFRRLSVDFLPPVSIPRLTIHTACPNLSLKDIDEKVAQPLAAAAGTVTGAKRTSSLCRQGTSVVTVEFFWGVSMDYAMLEMREKLDQLGSELPPEAGRSSILRIDPATEPVLSIGVTSGSSPTRGDSTNLVELTETCHALLKKRLEQVEGVARVSVLGGVEQEISVQVDESKLLALGLTMDEVAASISMENATFMGGTIRISPFRYPLRFLGELRSAREIAQLSFFSRASGRTVHLREIAAVHDTIRERNGWTRYNGNDILVLQVRKEAKSNTLTVSENVRHAVERLESENSTLRLHILTDQAEFIRSSVADVEQSILLGALLAFLALFFFLKGFRDSLIVGITMPVSILATLVAMTALGIGLNVISLTGLALGIGMLGDNATIVIENVRRLRELGVPIHKAILTSSREITLAVTASTMTNVAVFLPVLFVRSVAQQLFVDMAVTMTVSLLASLLVALTLVPVLLAWHPRVGRRESSPLVHHVSGLVQGREWMDRVLGVALRFRARVLLATAALFAACTLAAGYIPSEPAPEIDRKRFIIDLTMEAGTSPSALAEFNRRIESELRRIPGVTGVYAAGGIAVDPDISSLPDASLSHLHLEATVTESLQTSLVMEYTRKQLRSLCKNLSGTDFTVKPGATTFERILRPSPSDLVIRVQGSEPVINSRIAAEFARQIYHLPGLSDLSTPGRDGTPEYLVKVDKVAAERYGVTPRDIAEHISKQTAGEQATMLSDVDRQTVVRVQPKELGNKSMQDLLSSHMLSGDVPVQLRRLVTCEQAVGSTEIRREDGSHTVALTANVDGRSIGSVADDLRRKAALCLLPAGYSIIIGGENEEMESSFRSLAVVIVLSILLVYMILAAEYESLLYPFVILFTSPLAFIGAVLAMLLTGEKYNVMSLVGIVIMIGAVDNDAVIAVDVITTLRKEGMELREAIRRGMHQRLRPILMTTATTVLGILPLLLSFGEGSELVRALTIPLAGGLVTSTLFTLVIIPVIYTYVDSWAAKMG